jgi:16S rRNA (cytosine967-C5)-methyltransferase
MSVTPRERILDSLLRITAGSPSSGHLTKENSFLTRLEPRDRAFMKRVTEGTIERQIELDYVIDQYSNTPVKKMKPLIRCLMRMSVYQILYMDQVPDAAACNEAVLLAGKRGFAPLKGFVNGVLRQIVRQKDKLVYPDLDTDFEEALHIRYSMPKWILKLWCKEYGRETTRTMLEHLMAAHPVTIRFANRLNRTEMQQYLSLFTQKGVTWQPSPYSDRSWRLTHVEGVAALPGFQEGAFWVQDDSSVLSVLCAGIEPDDFVMDICAAPGGKSLLAAQTGAQVLSRDITPQKLSMITENRKRLDPQGSTLQVMTQLWDATLFDPAYEEKADVLLMDLPCSGLGVIGKKPDIKYRQTMDSLKQIVTFQREIIESSWRYVKPGGVLLYSTCTLNPEENEEQVAYICRNYPFRPEPITPLLPQTVLDQKGKIDQTCCHPNCLDKEMGQMLARAILRCLPGYLDTDGFFFAKLRRF